ncbi:unnamed protein product, partial [Gulo gulo]
GRGHAHPSAEVPLQKEEPTAARPLPRRPEEPELSQRGSPEAARLRLCREHQPQQGREGKSRGGGGGRPPLRCPPTSGDPHPCGS